MKMKKWALLLLVSAVATACAPSKLKPAMPNLVDTGKPALHAIDSNDLRELMKRLNNLMYERNLTSQEIDAQQRIAETQVKNAANDLNQAIDGIIATMPKLNLDPSEQKVFHSLALNLREDAYKLKFEAEAHQLEAIPGTLEKMSATCTSCHALFRDLHKSGAQ